jgi:myo-inositol 2-dehydrogenase / D-chiro-inositol 1-dehydrogenase
MTATSQRAFRQGNTFGYLEAKDHYLGRRTDANLRFGFIGCGIMGLEHMRNTLLEGRASIAGVYDPAPQSVKYALGSLSKQFSLEPPVIYGSIEDACADPHTDALIIATPNFTHLDVMREVVRSNKAIYLEKPVATTVADAYEICRLAAEYPQIVRIGLQYRYKAIYAEAIAEVFVRRSLGRVHSVNMLEHRFPFLDKVGQWNKFDEFSGGTLVEKCCHYFDLLNLFAGGTPTRIYASGSQAVNFKDFNYDNKPANALDNAQVVITYDNAVSAGFSLCMYVPGSREELTVCGEQGRMTASEQSRLGEPNENRLELWLGEHGVSRVTTPGYPSYITRAGHHGSTFFSHAAFVDDIERGSYQGPSLSEAFWSVVVGVAAQESIRTGQAVDVAGVLPAAMELDLVARAQQ